MEIHFRKNMNDIYQNLLRILNAFINEESPEISEETDWGELLKIAHIHSVDGIVGHMIRKHDLTQSEEIKALARELCLSTVALFNKRSALMAQLIDEMNNRRIEHILFKGYVVKDYYPVPELRSYGDIDFVIRESDRDKSHNMMLELGYEVKNNWEPVFSYVKDVEYYEIHTDVMDINVTDKADYKSYFKNIWNNAVKINNCSYQFTPEYHYIYMLTHIAKHIYGSGAGVRMYMDIALFIKHFGNSIDWDYIKESLTDLKLYEFSCVVLAAVRDWFGIVLPMDIKEVSADVMEEFTEFTLEAGVFGYVNRERGINTVRKEMGSDEGASRASIILKRLFPKASDIEKRYTYLKGRHWLLPAAWIHRLFRTGDKWREHSHEAHVIMSAGTDEVERLNKVHRDIGL